MQRVAGLCAVVLLLLGACSVTEDHLDQRLLILDGSGNVIVHDRAEGTTTEITTYEPDTAAGFQPIWAGEDHIVFSESSDTSAALVTARSNGAEVLRVELPTAPFYYAVEPGSSSEDGAGRLLSLRGDPGSAGLIAETIDENGTVALVGDEAPFYFSWAPDGGEVVAHIGSARLETVLASSQEIDAAPGGFQAPWWGEQGIIYLRSSGSSQILTVKDGDDVRDLAIVRGPAQMVLGGDRLAIQPLAIPETGGGAFEVRRQTLPAVPSNGLSVVDLDGGDVTPITTALVGFFQWDATNSKLLYAVPTDSARNLAWRVWEDGETSEYAEFGLDPEWLSRFLPFFDQYAQSMTLWAPSSDAFAFPGSIGGTAGVWVQALDGTPPQRVASGSWVTWHLTDP